MKNKIYYLVAFILLIAASFNQLSAKDEEGKVVQIDAANYQKETSKGVVLVDFWAPWCGPCRTMNPILNELAKEYNGVAKIAKLNVDKNELFAKKMNIQAIPTIIVYKDGKEVTRLRGAVPKKELEKAIKQYTATND